MTDNLDARAHNQDPERSFLRGLLKPLMNERGEVAVDGTPPAAPPVAAAPILDWRANLDPAVKDHPSLQKFKTPADLAKSYIEAERFLGREKIPLPPKDAKPEDWDMVFNSLGRPSDPNAYKVPEVKYPEGMQPASEDQLKEFKSFAHKIGLLPKQVEALFQWNHDRNVGYMDGMTKATTQSRQDAETGLRKEWGKAYDANLGLIKGLLGKFGDDGMSQLIESGLGNDPRFIKFAYQVAKNFGEDGQFLGGQAASLTLTPEEALAEISKIRNDKVHPYNAPSNPEHKKAVEYMAALYEMAYPGKG